MYIIGIYHCYIRIMCELRKFSSFYDSIYFIIILILYYHANLIHVTCSVQCVKPHINIIIQNMSNELCLPVYRCCVLLGVYLYMYTYKRVYLHCICMLLYIIICIPKHGECKSQTLPSVMTLMGLLA